MHNFFPILQIAVFRLQVQVLEHQCVHTFPREHDRYFVDRSNIFGGDNRLFLDVTEKRNLGLDVLGEEAVGSAQKNVGLNSDAEQLLD